jgi:hypothetical protein
MVAVCERPVHSDDMFGVIRICFVEAFEDSAFFQELSGQSGLVCENLDGDTRIGLVVEAVDHFAECSQSQNCFNFVSEAQMVAD